MHVHELNPKKTIVALLLFAIVIVIGFLTMHKPLMTYKLNMEQSLSMLNNPDACFYPWQIEDVINKKTNNVLIIDIRNNFVYGQGHIPGAKNISVFDLTKKANINFLKNLKKEGVTVVLCGDNRLQANAPWMLLNQVGFNNVKILLGGYSYYKIHKDNLAQTKNDNSYLKGIARFDYAKVASSSSSIGNSTVKSKKPILIRRKKKVAAAAGGC